MEKDSKSVAERAKELREIANRINSLSDEELEKAVGGLSGWTEQFRNHFMNPFRN